MNLTFLYPAIRPDDAIVEWIRVLTRHCHKHQVRFSPTLGTAVEADMVFLITQQDVYPPDAINADLWDLRKQNKPFAVVHNQDNPGVPMRSDYPSFCWTQTALRRLEAYKPTLVRQPVLPRVVEPKERPLHLGTFGRIETKKQTREMVQLAVSLGIPFTAFTAKPLTRWDVGLREKISCMKYIADLEPAATVVVHPWLEKIEDLAPLCDQVSHWLFVLPPSKEGTGGSPTCPRYAAAFGRPVIVVDDEDTFLADGFRVVRDLQQITTDQMRRHMGPTMDWPGYYPEAYVQTLVDLTTKFWEGA